MLKKLDSYLPDLSQCLIIMGLMILVGSVVSVLATVAIGFIFPSFEPYSQLLIYPLLFLPPGIYIYSKIVNQKDMAYVMGSAEKQIVPLNNPGFGRLGGVLSFILFFFLVFAFNLVTEPLSSWMGVPEFIRVLMQDMKDYPFTTFISVAIFAPLFEELLCRGIILRGLLHYYSPWKAILWSAGMFAVMHLNPWQAIPAFLIGSLMGWVYYKTRSLWATIFIHFINNGFSFAITVLFPQLPDDVTYASLIPGNYYYITFTIALLFTVGAIYIMNQKYDKPVSYKI
jgi:membrane protease YdiL (CAAX protease family)